jgi:hypothetical protein
MLCCFSRRVSNRCKELLENKRSKEITRSIIRSLRWAILSLAKQTQDAPFGMSDLELLEQAETLDRRAKNLFAETKAKAEKMRKRTSTASTKGRTSE